MFWCQIRMIFCWTLLTNEMETTYEHVLFHASNVKSFSSAGMNPPFAFVISHCITPPDVWPWECYKKKLIFHVLCICIHSTWKTYIFIYCHYDTYHSSNVWQPFQTTSIIIFVFTANLQQIYSTSWQHAEHGQSYLFVQSWYHMIGCEVKIYN